MTFTDYLIESAVEFDAGQSAPVYDFYVSRDGRGLVASVSFRLADTPILNSIADRIRFEHGEEPIYDKKYSFVKGYYFFEYGLDQACEFLAGRFIRFKLCGSTVRDNGVPYIIELDRGAQEAARRVLDEQLKSRFGLDCEEMIKVSETKMIEGE